MKRRYSQSEEPESRRPTLFTQIKGADRETGSRRPFPETNRRGPQIPPRPPRDRHDPALAGSYGRTNAADLNNPFVPPPAAGPQAPVTRPSGSKRKIFILIGLALVMLVIALLRFDLLPLFHVGAESLILASILSGLSLLGYLFYLFCHALWRLYLRGYKMFMLIVPFVFVAFTVLYLSLNIAAQAFDPAIDRVLSQLPPPGRKTIFARRQSSYEQVALPMDRRVDTDEIADSAIRDSIIAVEDERLETRFGSIDLEALLRGAVRTFILRRRREGGSTILIQAAKNILKFKAGSDQSKAASEAKPEGKESLSKALARKCAELLMSLRLAQRFPRADEQLALYISVSPMGGATKNGRFQTLPYIAEDLFGVTDLRNLKADTNSLLSAAVLVGMLKDPTKYNPRLHPSYALTRRQVALEQMAKKGMFTQDVASLQMLPIVLRDTGRTKSTNFYYNASIARGVAQ